MTKPRKEQISTDATPYYHLTARCVRRAYLCGTDENGHCYEHRRQWIEDKLLFLAEVFALDIAAYAVMSNHYHVVVHLNPQRAKDWCDLEVIKRWHRLFHGKPLSRQLLQDANSLSREERLLLKDLIEEWRERLAGVSWFMRIINENIAREANKEDKCKGRFWESRYCSQALLDEAAVMSCMAYVDLNPIRAKIAKTPEQSAHTSLKKRFQQAKLAPHLNQPHAQPKELMRFSAQGKTDTDTYLPFKLSDYLEYVDWIGRAVREDKRGAIDAKLPSIMDRLGLSPEQQIKITQDFEEEVQLLAGRPAAIEIAAESMNYQRRPRCRAFESTG